MKLYRNAIILVVIVALLGGAYYLISKKKTADSVDNTSTADTIKMTDYTSDQVESLTLQNPDGTFVLVKNGTEWSLSSPTDIKADSSKLSSIVINASSVIADKLVEENAQDLSIYGLDNPILVKLKLKDGGEKVLEVGDMTPTKGGYYVKLSGENKVYVVGSYTGDQLVTGRNALRDKTLFGITPDMITQLSMDRNGQNVFASSSDKDSNWTMNKPIKGSVNSSALSPMLEALAGTNVKEFIEDHPSDLSKYGLDKPSYAFDFSTTTAGAFKLLLGGEKTKGSEMYAMLEGKNEVFTIDSTPYVFLDKPLKEIVDVFAYIVNIDQVTAIDLTMDGKTTKMTLDTFKDAEGKSDADQDKFTVNGQDASGKDEDGKQPFRNFYQSLIGISLDEIDVEGTPTGTPELSIYYTLKTGTMKVDFISKDANFYYVVRNGEYAGILVKKNKMDYGVLGMKDAYKTMMDFLSTQK